MLAAKRWLVGVQIYLTLHVDQKYPCYLGYCKNNYTYHSIYAYSDKDNTFYNPL